jgi:hypothetical protein
MARRRRALWQLGICGASERRMQRSATPGRAGSAADAAAPALDLGACDVAPCMKTMFVDARVIRGDAGWSAPMVSLVATVCVRIPTMSPGQTEMMPPLVTR